MRPELGVNRRFVNGLQFGFSDTWVLSDVGNVPPRYDHGPDGQVVLRADQAEAQELLGDQQTPTHNFKATFVWQLPRLPSSDNTALKAVGYAFVAVDLEPFRSGRLNEAAGIKPAAHVLPVV